MSARQTTSAHSRRPRSAEDESPLVVTSIAILGVVVLTCVGLMAPVVWSAFVDSPGNAGAGSAAARKPRPRRNYLLGQDPPASVPAASERGARAAYSALMRMACLRSRIHMRP